MQIDITISGATPALIEALGSHLKGGAPTAKQVVEAVKSHNEEMADSDIVVGGEQLADLTMHNGIELDTSGVPWDERIHSSNRKKTAKGAWARRRNLTDDVYNRIHAELLTTQGASLAAPAPVEVEVEADTPPPPPPLDATPAPTSYPELIARIAQGGYDNETVQAACEIKGVPNIGALFNRPDLIPAIWECLQ